jgi:hypothetical protein
LRDVLAPFDRAFITRTARLFVIPRLACDFTTGRCRPISQSSNAANRAASTKKQTMITE